MSLLVGIRVVEATSTILLAAEDRGERS